MSVALPSYAFPSHSPRAESERDIFAEFRSEEGDSIQIGIERCEAGMFNLVFWRSGLSDQSFSKADLRKAVDVAGKLVTALETNAKVIYARDAKPERMPLQRKPEHDVNLDGQLQQFATLLVNLAHSDLQELYRLCLAVWPKCNFYRGGTHVRVFIEGTSNGKSFYVETI